MCNNLSGKVAIITGAGKKKGIGRAIALWLAREGADVVVADVQPGPDLVPPEDGESGWQGLPSLVGEIEALGRQAMAVYTDISDAAQVPEMVSRTLDRFG